MENTIYNAPLPMPAALPQQTLFPIPDFVALPEFSFLTENGMRHLIFNGRDRKSASGDVIRGNGLFESGAVVRLGRRVLIDVNRFREWMERQRDKANE